MYQSLKGTHYVFLSESLTGDNVSLKIKSTKSRSKLLRWNRILLRRDGIYYAEIELTMLRSNLLYRDRVLLSQDRILVIRDRIY